MSEKKLKIQVEAELSRAKQDFSDLQTKIVATEEAIKKLGASIENTTKAKSLREELVKLQKDLIAATKELGKAEKEVYSVRAKEATEYVAHARKMLQVRLETDPILRNELKLQIELNRTTSAYAGMIATAKERYAELGMSAEAMHTEVKRLLKEESTAVATVNKEYAKKAAKLQEAKAQLVDYNNAVEANMASLKKYADLRNAREQAQAKTDFNLIEIKRLEYLEKERAKLEAINKLEDVRLQKIIDQDVLLKKLADNVGTARIPETKGSENAIFMTAKLSEAYKQELTIKETAAKRALQISTEVANRELEDRNRILIGINNYVKSANDLELQRIQHRNLVRQLEKTLTEQELADYLLVEAGIKKRLIIEAERDVLLQDLATKEKTRLENLRKAHEATVQNSVAESKYLNEVSRAIEKQESLEAELAKRKINTNAARVSSFVGMKNEAELIKLQSNLLKQQLELEAKKKGTDFTSRIGSGFVPTTSSISEKAVLMVAKLSEFSKKYTEQLKHQADIKLEVENRETTLRQTSIANIANYIGRANDLTLQRINSLNLQRQATDRAAAEDKANFDLVEAGLQRVQNRERLHQEGLDLLARREEARLLTLRQAHNAFVETQIDNSRRLAALATVRSAEELSRLSGYGFASGGIRPAAQDRYPTTGYGLSQTPYTPPQSQEALVASMRQRLYLLDLENQEALAKTKFGVNSTQVTRLAAQKKLLQLEEEFQAKLHSIKTSGKTKEYIEAESKKLIATYQSQIAEQQKLTRSTDELRSAHMNLFKFIGVSMITWQIWHTALYRTRDLLASIPKVGMELETSKSVLEATMGGRAGAEVALRGLHDEAKRTGIQIDALRETWRTFSASTTIAGESVETSWRIFTKMNTVVTALHYSGDKASHIFMALAQMFNKGKIQSEELVKQLGNLLPGAFAAFAKANDISTKELISQMKKGLVSAHGTIENFTDFYANRFEQSFALASNSLNANLGRMNSALIQFKESIYTKIVPSLVELVKGFTKLIESFKADTVMSFLDHVTTVFLALAVTTIPLLISQLGKLALAVKALVLSNPYTAAFSVLTFAGVEAYEYYKKYTEKTRGVLDVAREQLKEFKELKKASEEAKPLEVKVEEDTNVIKAKAIRDSLIGRTFKLQKELDDLNINLFSTTKSKERAAQIKRELLEIGIVYKDAETTLLKQREEARTTILDQQQIALNEANQAFLDSEKHYNTLSLVNSEDALKKKQGLQDQYDEQHLSHLSNFNLRVQSLLKEQAIQNYAYPALKTQADLSEAEAFSKLSEEEQARRKRSTADSLREAKEVLQKYYEDRDRIVEQGLNKETKTVAKGLKDQEQDRKEAIARSLAETKDLYDRLLSSKKDEIERLKADKTLPELERNKLVAAAQAEYTATLDKNIVQLKEQLRLESTRDSKRISNAKGAVDIEAKLLEASQRQHLDYQKLQEAFDKAAAKSGVPVGILKAQAYQESKFDTNVVSPAGAVGFSQFMPATATRFGLSDRTNPYESIRAMGDYMAFLMDTFSQNREYALAAYNTGEGNLGKALTRATKAGTGTTVGELNLAKETKDYVQSVLGYAKQAGEEGSAYASILAEITAKEKERNSAISEGKELSAERSKILQDFSQLVASTEENYLALIGEQTKESAKWNKQAAANEELVKSMLASGDELAVKNALRYNQLTQAAEKYQEVLEKIQDLQNKSVVDFIPYKEKRAELDRMQSVGLESSFTAGWQKDKIALAEKSIKEVELRGREQQLEALKTSILQENPNADLLSNDKYVEQLSAISDLKIAIADLGLQSQSTFLTLSETISSSFDQTFRGLMDGSITAGNAFRSFASGVVKGLAEIAIQAAVTQLKMLAFKAITGIGSMIMGGLGGLGGLGGATSMAAGSFTPSNLSSMSAAITPNFSFAKGGAFDHSSNIVPFAKGGIVSQPTLFKFAKGTGLMGEAGAEAIMPLARDSQGRLGVRQQSANNNSPVINNNYVINVTVDGKKGESPDQLGGKVAEAIMTSIAKREIMKANQLGGVLKPATRKVG